jgi:tetratricopeptide (TPR) repeat protein
MSDQQQTLTIQQAIDLGVQHHKAGRLSEAENVYQQILQTSPDQPVALHLLGVIAHQVGKNDVAVDLIIKALAIKPDFAEAHNNLGNALRELGRLDEAVTYYHKAIDLKPDFAEAHYNLGIALQDLGKLDEAIASYRKALAIKPDYAEAHYNLSNAFKELGKLDEAVASYHKALAIKPDYAEAHNNLGNALRHLGRLDDAVASYRKALAIKPDYAEAHNNLGAAFAELGKREDAVASYRTALSIKPDYVMALFNLHATCYGSADLEPAARHLEEAVRIAPEDRKVQFFLGMIRDYQKNSEQAKKHFLLLRNGTDTDAARLDSWQYIKSLSASLPRLFCHTPDGLRIGIEAAQIGGLVLEFGVLFGTTIRHLSAIARQDVHGFDSFQGLPEAWHNRPKGEYSTHGKLPEVSENVHLHVGFFGESLPPFLKKHTDPIRFLHVDCDLFSSTKTILSLLRSRIVPGTIIVFDEFFLDTQNGAKMNTKLFRRRLQTSVGGTTIWPSAYSRSKPL